MDSFPKKIKETEAANDSLQIHFINNFEGQENKSKSYFCSLLQSNCKNKQIYYIELLLIIALQSIVVVLDLFKNEKQAKNKQLP